MTAYVTFKCNDDLPSGMLCRGAFSTEADTSGPAHPSTVEKAWAAARELGWTYTLHRLDDGKVRIADHCPSCTRRLAVNVSA